MKNVLISACLLGLPCRYDGKAKTYEAVEIVRKREDITLIPVCPEQLGGLPTPRPASEKVGDKVINQEGVDVTVPYTKGAEGALYLAGLYDCNMAILKEKSPSCGCGRIYDGSFQRRLIEGDGVTAALLKSHGIPVIGESQIESHF